jgi:RNA polymerase sigma-70 factor (ECF subfamily)
MLAGTLAVEARRTATDEDTEAFSLDEAAFSAFYERTVRPLWAYLARSCGSGEAADDLVQEAYYRLLRSGFETASDEHRKNYLFRIGTNLVRDRFRRSKWLQLPLGDEQAVERRPGAGPGLRLDLHEHLMKLRPRDRQLLWLAYAEGLSHREISRVLDLKEASVRLLLFRARKKLAALLRESGVGPEVIS